jgi:hypothetical protein
MKWKNPAELGKLGFRLRGTPKPADPEVEYELCLADEDNAMVFEIVISFSRPHFAGTPFDGGPFVYSGAELRLHRLRRERLAGPWLRGPFLAARPLFFESFAQVESFVSALTGTTALFPEEQEPLGRLGQWNAEHLYRSALSALAP